MQIGHLTSPYTLMETVTLLYGHLPTSDLIHTTTEMLAQPMVTLWQNISDKYGIICTQPNQQSRVPPRGFLKPHFMIIGKVIL